MALATGTVAADQWHGLGPGLGLSVALAPLDAPVVAAAQAGLAFFGDCAVGLTSGVAARLQFVHPGACVGRHVARVPDAFLVSACFFAVPRELLGWFALSATPLQKELAFLRVAHGVAVFPRLLLVTALLWGSQHRREKEGLVPQE